MNEIRQTEVQLNLRYVVFGGEALNFSSLAPWYEKFGASGAQLVNMYGITETTVHVSYRPLCADDVNQSASHIGHPLADLQIHLLDTCLQVVPVGVVGEMFVGGAGVARGYLNRPELTKSRFVPNPFTKTPELMYRTGDLGRRLQDGTIEYFGRIDNQVKIRGFRIELGEIESQITQLQGVASALTLARSDTGRMARLIAYVVPNPGADLSSNSIIRELRGKLPEHMVPSICHVIAEWPLTSNGKVDTTALSKLIVDRGDNDAEFAAPQGHLSGQFDALWSQVLGVKYVGESDNFFSLGGDSMLAVVLVQEARKSGFHFSVRELFQHQTVEALVKLMQDRQAKALVETPKLSLSNWSKPAALELVEDLEDAYPLSDMQSQMLRAYSSHVQIGSGVYHPQRWVRMRQANGSSKLMEQALQLVVDSQPVLRSVLIGEFDGAYWQGVRRSLKVSLRLHDLRQFSLMKQDEIFREILSNDRFDPLFDIKHQEGALRLHWIELGEGEFRLLLSTHHALDDGWSSQYLFWAVLSTYSRLCEGEVIAALPVHLNVLRERIAHEFEARDSMEARRYWKAAIDPVNVPSPERRNSSGHRLKEISIPIEARLVQAALRKTARENISIKALLLSCYLQCLSETMPDISRIIGVVSNGRTERLSDALTSLGLFWNMIPLERPEHSPLGAVDYPTVVHRKLLEQEQFALFPLGEIARLHGVESFFQTSFNFTNFKDSPVEIDLKGISFSEAEWCDRFEYPLNCRFSLHGEQAGALLRFVFDANVFASSNIESLAELLVRSIEVAAIEEN